MKNTWLKQKSRWISVAGIFVGLSGFSSASFAAAPINPECLPGAKQGNVLAASCPIGHGLWGSKQPQKLDSQYWIQCGMLKNKPSSYVFEQINKKVSAKAWVKKEPAGYRCLIGPYQRYQNAKTDQITLRSDSSFRGAIIREVLMNDKNIAIVADTGAVKKITAVKVAPKVPKVEKKVFTADLNIQQILTAEDVEIRRSAKVENKNYAIPFLLDNNDSFYMENEIAWSRATFDASSLACDHLSMRLVTADEWQTLRKSGVMEQEKWPQHLPYWGEKKQAMFSNGTTRKLNDSSLLNVVCVKS